jgi:hypothetical protein
MSTFKLTLTPRSSIIAVRTECGVRSAECGVRSAGEWLVVGTGTCREYAHLVPSTGTSYVVRVLE